MTPAVCGIALAAGEGRRLRPLTQLRPKPLCPVGLRPLLDHALDRLTTVVPASADQLAVNAHHLAEQMVGHVAGRAHVAVEPQLLGTAGAVGNLLAWIDGRDVLLTNSDAFLMRPTPSGPAPADLGCLLPSGSDRADRVRLLVTRPDPLQRADFADPGGDPRGWRYIGACYLPFQHLAGLKPEPSGLYEKLWRDLAVINELDFVEFAGVAVDCGTPADYLRANLAGGGGSVIDPSAVVEGRIEECVVWDGARVGPDEDLVRCIRAGTPESPLTVKVP